MRKGALAARRGRRHGRGGVVILVIDNHDSFTHNLARYVRLAGAQTRIVRNDAIDPVVVLDPALNALVVSPGPGGPADAGVCLPVLHLLAHARPELPVLGVCLGHQCLVESVGGRTVRAMRPMHGEASAITHDGSGVFSRMKGTLNVGRYHSLISILPHDGGGMAVAATSEEGEVMAVRHLTRPWHGVQFHPESLLTETGMVMIANFVALIPGRCDA